MPGPNQATVTWTAAVDNGSLVTRYLATASVGAVAKNAEAVDGTTNSLVLSGLSGGTEYTVQVIATSDCGDGPAATSGAFTPTGSTSTYPSNVLANAPSAYYRLGDTSGLTAADSSGKGRQGLYGQATLGTAGAVLGDPDTGARANGSCCVARSSPTLPLYNTARTVEAWIKPADANNRYVASWGAYGTDQEFSLVVGATSVGIVGYNDDRYFTTPRPLNDGAWHHVAVTYDGTMLTGYFDGVSLGTRTFGAPLDTLDAYGLVIGSRFSGEAPFYGDLDEVAVYPTSLTAANISAHFSASGYGPPAAVTGLVAFAGTSSADVAWSPASSPAPVSRYLVTAYDGAVAKNAEAVDGGTTSLVLSGLSGGTAYTIKVVASSAYGDAPAAVSAAVTPSGSATTYSSSVLANAPSAYYRLGDPSGRTAADSSGQGHPGRYNQATLGSAGAIAADSDGAAGANGSCCVARSAPTLPLYNSARSVEAWVKPADTYPRYVASWGSYGTDQEFSLLVGPTWVGVIGYNDDRSFTTPRPLNDGSWHHLVVTYDGTTLIAYMDGASLGSRTFASPLDTLDGSGLAIGARHGGDAPFYGDLDEVAVYPTALTPADVSAHFGASGNGPPAAVTDVAAFAGPSSADVSWSQAASASPISRYVVTAFDGAVAKNAEAVDGDTTSLVMTGLTGGTTYTFQIVASGPYGDGAVATSPAVTPTGPASTYASSVLANGPSAYYRFGESSGRTAADSSGKGRHATYDQATLGSPGAVVGDPDTGVNANGSCCVARSSPTLPAFNTARTVEAWIRPVDGNDRYLAAWGSTGTRQAFSIMVGRTSIGVFVNNDDRSFAAPRPLNDGIWHHVAITYDGTTLTAYLDGVSLGTRVFSAPLDTLDVSGLTVGAHLVGYQPFAGSLDELAVYPAALTAAQVTTHVAASGFSRPGVAPGVVATAGANQVTVSWSPPVSATPLTRYMVTALAGTVVKNAEATDGGATSLVMSGLSGGTAYTFQVVASNIYGDGPTATSPVATPAGPSATYVTSVLANAPSAYYRFGDTSGRTAADSSGKGRHGIYDQVTLGSAGAVLGDPDTAADANGSCCVVRSSPTLPVFNTARSVEAWVKPADSGDHHVASWGVLGTDQEFSVVVTHDAVGVLGYNDDRYFKIPKALNDGSWHHVVVTYSGSSLVAYLDGLSLGAKTFSAPLDTLDGSGLYVGGRLNGGPVFLGGLDEVAVYPTSLSAADVAAHFAASGLGRPAAVTNLTVTAGTNRATVAWTGAATPSTSPVTSYVITAYVGSVAKNAEATKGSSTSLVITGLAGGTGYTFQVVAVNAYGVGSAATSAAATPSGSASTYAANVLASGAAAYYRLGDTSGPLAADSSGKGRHATYGQATLSAAGAAVGDPDTAVLTNGYFVAQSPAVMPLYNTARSVEAWVKPSDRNFHYIAGWGTAATDRTFSVGFDGANVGVLAYNDDRYFALPRPLNDGAWHHVAVTYNGTNVVAYVDGVSLGSKTFSAPLATLNTSGLMIGADFQGSQPFYGGLDEVAVHTVALTGSQVLGRLVAAGYGRPAAVTNLTATAGGNQATVSWSGASSPNTPVTGYLVTAYAGSAVRNAEATAGTSTSLVVTGLSGGTAYTFRVVATNAYGDGAVATSAAVTPTGAAATYVTNVLVNAPSAYYRLGETSGRTAADSSGRGRHATYDQVTPGAAGAAAVTPTGSAATYVTNVLANAPSAYYRLGETSGRTGADSSGKGRHAIYDQATPGAAGAVTGDTDTAVAGYGSCCVARSTAILPLYDTARSVEAWVKPTYPYYHYIAGWGTAATDRSFSVGFDDTNLSVAAYNDDRSFVLPHPLGDGLWHHVVVTYSGTSLVAYLDGVALGTQTFSAPLATLNTSGLVIGANFQGSYPFYGGLDEVAIYPVALTAAQVSSHHSSSLLTPAGSPPALCPTPDAPTGLTALAGANQATVTWSPSVDNGSPVTRYLVTAFAGTVAKNAEATDGAATSVVISGLPGGVSHTFKVAATSSCGDGPAATSAAVSPTGPATTYSSSVIASSPAAYYRLGEDSGLTAADSSGKGSHAVLERATLGWPGAIVSDPDTSARGDAGGRLAIASPTLPLYNSARTVEAWIKPVDYPYNRYIASWGTYGTDQEFSFVVGPNTLGVVGYSDDRYFTTPRPLSDGAWHHVAVTYDGTTLTGYVDGASLGTRIFNAPLDTLDAYGLSIGSAFNGGSPFYGDLDEVAVYSTSLTAATIGAHFSASGHGPPDAPRAPTASYAGDNQLNVSWGVATSPDPPLAGYLVTAYTGTTPVNAVAVGGNKTAVRMSGLSGGTAYTFQIVASNTYGDSPVAVSPPATPTGSASTYASGVLANAPVAYYRLGERSSRIAADSSGKGRHGAYDGAVIGVPGALVTDPDTAVTNDAGRQVVRSSPALPLYNTARSVEAWIKPIDGNDRYIASWGNAGNNQEFSLSSSSTAVGVVTYNDDRSFATSRPLNDGAWHHVVITYDGTTVTAYVDGTSLGTRSFANALDTLDASGLHVGARFNGQSLFYGDIDEVAVYPTSLTAVQVSAHFAASGYARPAAVTALTATAADNAASLSWSPASSVTPVTRYVVTAYAGTVAKLSGATDGAATGLTMTGLSGATAYTFQVVASNAYGDGPVATSAVVTPTGSATTYASNVLGTAASAYYRLGETSGRTAADSSGKGRHGTYDQAALGSPGAIVGDPDTAVVANGACCVARSQAVMPLYNTARSVEAWVKPGDRSFRYIAGWGTAATDRSFSVGLDGTNLGVVAYADDRYFPLPHALDDGAWHHVAVTYAGTSLTAYVDGSSLGTQSFSAPLSTLNTSGLVIGADFQGGGPFNGSLDEVAVHPLALTAAQVSGRFAAGGFSRPGAVTNLTATPGTNQVTLSWTEAPSPSSSPVTRHLVTAYAGTAAKLSGATDGAATSMVMSGLSGGTAYTFRVVASNAYGDGAVATSPLVTPTGSAATYASNVLASGASAYYRLGDASGGTAADSSGKGRHGTYGQAVLGAAGAVVGDPDTGVSANWSCCVARSQAVMPLQNAARSVEAWVKPTDTNFHFIAGWGTAATDRSFSVGFDGTNVGVLAYNDDRYFALPRPLNDGAWHYVAVTYNGTSLSAYLDGILLGTKSLTAALTTLNTSGLVIGADFQGYQPFYGGLDEVAVHAVALTGSQVLGRFGASGFSRPAAVTDLTATAGSNQSTVSWSGASSPETPVTRYLVTAYVGSTAKLSESIDGANTSLVMTGLVAGTAYTFQVVAANAYGNGSPASSAAVTPTGSATTYASNVLGSGASAYYRFGDTSGQTAADSSGKGRHGTYGQSALGAPGAIVGDTDPAVVANGSCCVARSPAVMPLYNTARSVEAWVKPTDTGFHYVAGWGTAATDRSFSVGLDSTNLGVVAYGDDRYFALPRPLNDGAWHFVAVTYNGTSVVAYVDGLSLGSKAFSAPLATFNTSGLVIGADFQGSQPFYGGLDEVAVHAVALTGSQVLGRFGASGFGRPGAVTNLTATPGSNRATVLWSGASSPNTPVSRYVVTAFAGAVAKSSEATDGPNTSVVISGLVAGTAYTFQVVASNAYGDGAVATSAAVTPTGVASTYASTVQANAPSAYYRLGDTSGRTAADSSANRRHGMYDQATLGAAGSIVGDPDTAVNASGSCCVSRSPAVVPLYNTARSVEAWVKPLDTSFRHIAGWGTAAVDRSFSVGLDGTNLGVVAYGDNLYFALPHSLNDGAWHHVVVTYSGTSVVAYLDGVSLGSQAFAAPLATLNTSGLVIGAEFQGSQPFYGSLDEVAVYPVALTAAQVTAHYNARP